MINRSPCGARRRAGACALLLMAVGSLGCSGNPMPQVCSGGTGGFGGVGGGAGGGSAVEPVGLVGAPLTVTMSVSVFTACFGVVPKADEVVIEVLDPSSRPVANTFTALVALPGDFSRTGGWSTDVRFTPATAGSYHLSARFEPSIGRAQLDVDVAADRSAAVLQELKLPSACDALETLPSGLRLCEGGDLVGKLRVYRDQALVQTLDADDFAVAGSVVWITRGATVDRWVDTGGSTFAHLPLQTFTNSFSDGRAARIFALENEAVVVGPTLLSRLELVGGVIALASRFEFGGSEPSAVFARPDLNGVLIVQPTQRCQTVRRPPGTFEGCTPQRAQPLGADASGLWWLEQQTLHHATFGATLEAPLVTLTLPLREASSSQAETPRHFEGSPVVAPSARDPALKLLLAIGADGIFFEKYAPAAGFTLMPSTRQTVRAQAADGRQQLFTR